MFLTTGEINRTYTIKGIVNATVKKELTSDQLDQVAIGKELWLPEFHRPYTR